MCTGEEVQLNDCRRRLRHSIQDALNNEIDDITSQAARVSETRWIEIDRAPIGARANVA